MRERPILFSAPMVRALLAGTKTQTRRAVATRYPIEFLGGVGQQDDLSCWGWFFDGPDQHGYMVLERGLNEHHNNGHVSIPCPYGEPGDRLWVRETFSPYAVPGGMPSSIAQATYVVFPDGGQMYRDGFYVEPLAKYAPGAADHIKWRPSIHMPRWASRILLEVTDVRVQRLQEISEADARAEGVGSPITRDQKRPGFMRLWDEINGARCPWDSNPWVWAVSFRRLEVAHG